MQTAAIVLVAAASFAGCLGQTTDNGGLAPETNTTAPPSDRNLTWASPREATVRPGVDIADGGCTANFIFRSSDNRSVYIGTAAHCFNGPNNESRTGLNETVMIAGGQAKGRLSFVGYRPTGPYGSGQPDNASHDFALVEVAASDRQDIYPGMYAYGGPTGLASDVAVGDTVRTFGNSTFRDDADGLDGRNGTVTDARLQDDGEVRALFRPPSVPGDSGSPVVTADGRAVGTLITGDVFYVPSPPWDDALPSTGTNGIAWLPWSLEHVRETSNLEPILVTVSGESAT